MTAPTHLIIFVPPVLDALFSHTLPSKKATAVRLPILSYPPTMLAHYSNEMNFSQVVWQCVNMFFSGCCLGGSRAGRPSVSKAKVKRDITAIISYKCKSNKLTCKTKERKARGLWVKPLTGVEKSGKWGNTTKYSSELKQHHVVGNQ